MKGDFRILLRNTLKFLYLEHIECHPRQKFQIHVLLSNLETMESGNLIILEQG